jgi:hypothetical protein
MRFASVLLLVGLFLAGKCHADAKVFGVNAGANAVSFAKGSTPAFPSDFELGGTGSASLSPHISAVGGLWYGVTHTYLRSTVGARLTVTDATNEYLSAAVGLEYQSSSEFASRPQEWVAVASVGYVPFPKLEKVILVAQAGYGLNSNTAMLVLGVRYHLAAF